MAKKLKYMTQYFNIRKKNIKVLCQVAIAISNAYS